MNNEQTQGLLFSRTFWLGGAGLLVALGLFLWVVLS